MTTLLLILGILGYFIIGIFPTRFITAKYISLKDEDFALFAIWLFWPVIFAMELITLMSEKGLLTFLIGKSKGSKEL
jgi:hypothetical protein